MRIPFRKLATDKVSAEPAEARPAPALPGLDMPDFDIAPNDPLVPYLLSAHGPVEIDRVQLESPALARLKAAGVQLVAPLIGQGELIGLLNLGPRLSEQEYSSDDRKLLADLAMQAAPAVRVAQLVRQQKLEAQARERLEQQLRVARVIQQTLLPKEVPALSGWQVAAHWQPALAVSGDFYDFIELPGGKLGFVVADVTDKGVPAALVMATARTMLRLSAEQFPESPSQVLERVNELLCPDIPPNMFVTCLYGVLDPASGRLIFANAGHNLPSKCTREAVTELRATGMPLGLLPGMTYDEGQATLNPGESILVYSDGLVEAHNPQGDMFGFPRLRSMACSLGTGQEIIDHLRAALADFTGPGWEQEDDVTFVVIERLPLPQQARNGNDWREIASFEIASEQGNERIAMHEVANALAGFAVPEAQMERLKTAVAEATMNAMEHGNKYREDLPVKISVLCSESALRVDITDEGGGPVEAEAAVPDIEAKLEGLQSPRGWGFFLIKNMVDQMNVRTGADHHTVELIVNLEGTRGGNHA